MIIFDLDGTLADCEHRRHFVDPKKDPNATWWSDPENSDKGNYIRKDGLPWYPDWKSFYEACDKDTPIYSTINLINVLTTGDEFGQYPLGEIEIWSGRCESVRQKTMDWIKHHIFPWSNEDIPKLRMRPIGNSTPDHELKEMWLLDVLLIEGKEIECVFDDRPKVIRMWRDHGIFVFNCCQHDEEF